MSVNFPAPGICVSRCAGAWPCEAWRAARAVEEVLKLAGDARPTSFSVVGTGPLKPIAWDLDLEKLGAAILAELTGKGKGNA